ncbi:MAG: hypothetical protein ACREDQ_01645 [Limisphaerales bacterium]
MFCAALAYELRDPITPPEPPLPQAYQRALQALGAETNTFYCVNATSLSLSENLGSCEWHFEFFSTNGRVREVFVGSSGKTIVRNPDIHSEKVWSTPFEVSHNPAYNEEHKNLKVNSNNVVFIKTQSGAVALIQFTGFDTHTDPARPSASYRWRYSSTPSATIQSGKGQVHESYDRKPTADGKDVEAVPKADHDPIVKAGDIWIEWSANNESSGWLYYYPSRAEIQVLSPNTFDKAL